MDEEDDDDYEEFLKAQKRYGRFRKLAIFNEVENLWLDYLEVIDYPGIDFSEQRFGHSLTHKLAAEPSFQNGRTVLSVTIGGSVKYPGGGRSGLEGASKNRTFRQFSGVKLKSKRKDTVYKKGKGYPPVAPTKLRNALL